MGAYKLLCHASYLFSNAFIVLEDLYIACYVFNKVTVNGWLSGLFE